jgi:hypothetical protein
MDKIHRFLCVLLLACVESGIVPVYFNRDGAPQIITDLAIGGFWHSGIRNTLHIGSESRLCTSNIYAHDDPPMLHFPTFSVSLRSHTCYITTQHRGDLQLLAIGPGSDVVTTFGSIALVQGVNYSGLLLIEPREEDFVNLFCLPNSSMRITTHVHRDYEGIPQIIGRMSSFSSQQIPIRFTPIENIINIHPNIFEELFDEFPLIGNRSVFSIANCTEIRQSLPEIHLELTTDHRIVLTPQDYTRYKYNTEDERIDECDILIGISLWIGDDSTPIEMNPLLIPGFSSFASDDYFILCESLEYTE